MIIVDYGCSPVTASRRVEMVTAARADGDRRWRLLPGAPVLARLGLNAGGGMYAVVASTESGWWWHVECAGRQLVPPRRCGSLAVALMLARFRAEYERVELVRAAARARHHAKRRSMGDVRDGSKDDLRNGGGGGVCSAGAGAGDVRRSSGQPDPAGGGVPPRSPGGWHSSLAA